MFEINDLACLRGDRLLFRHLNLSVQAGELWRVAGTNGIGKTSLLRLLCGLTVPAAGVIRWLSQPIEREVFDAALLYQGHAPALNDLLTPVENLRFACAIAGQDISVDVCTAALTRIGLARQLILPCKLLSQGQRRRVGLARLFLAAHKPLWILDEPFTALDAAASAQIAEAIDTHCAAGGAAIFTSHQDVVFAREIKVLDMEGLAR